MLNLVSIYKSVQYNHLVLSVLLSTYVPPQLPVVTEISVFGVEVGCGPCVDQLLVTLARLIALINTGFGLLPGGESVELLRQGIEEVLVRLGKSCFMNTADLTPF